MSRRLSCGEAAVDQLPFANVLWDSVLRTEYAFIENNDPRKGASLTLQLVMGSSQVAFIAFRSP